MVVRQACAEGGGRGPEKKVPGRGNRMRNPALKGEIRSLGLGKVHREGHVAGLVRWVGR